MAVAEIIVAHGFVGLAGHHAEEVAVGSLHLFASVDVFENGQVLILK